MSCGENSLLDGGVIQNGTIANSQLTNSAFLAGRVDSATIANSSIENLATLDAASARVIANALAELPAQQLRLLAEAILDQMKQTPTVLTTAPESTDAPTLSTVVYGDRDKLLGAPALWLEQGNLKIPAFV